MPRRKKRHRARDDKSFSESVHIPLIPGIPAHVHISNKAAQAVSTEERLQYAMRVLQSAKPDSDIHKEAVSWLLHADAGPLRTATSISSQDRLQLLLIYQTFVGRKHPNAFVLLGDLLVTDPNRPDVDEAMRVWTTGATEHNSMQACLRVAEFHKHGFPGIEKNAALSVEFFRRAAENGNAHAQLQLAKALLDGKGDEKEALMWYNLHALVRRYYIKML